MSLQTPTTIRKRQWKLFTRGAETYAEVSSLDTSIERPTIVGLAVKPIGKPSAGNRHARFDERGWETERWPLAPSYRAHPRLSQSGRKRMSASDGTADPVLNMRSEEAHRDRIELRCIGAVVR